MEEIMAEVDDMDSAGQERTSEESKLQVNYYLLIILPLFCVADKFLARVSTWISTWFFQPSEVEQRRFEEAVKLKTEMKKLSVVDDFAAYSKLQRKLNLVTLGLETDSAARQALRRNLTRTISLALYVIFGIWYSIILATHGTSTPVLILPTKWLYPFNSIFSFPTGVDGGLSVLFWTLISRTFITQFV